MENLALGWFFNFSFSLVAEKGKYAAVYIFAGKTKRLLFYKA